LPRMGGVPLLPPLTRAALKIFKIVFGPPRAQEFSPENPSWWGHLAGCPPPVAAVFETKPLPAARQRSLRGSSTTNKNSGFRLGARYRSRSKECLAASSRVAVC